MILRAKVIMLTIVLLFAALMSGCETTKGVAQGVGSTVDSTAKGVAQDTKNLFSAIYALDGWIKKNLW